MKTQYAQMSMTIPFGKYKGQVWEDAPTDYLCWMHRVHAGDFIPGFRKQLRYILRERGVTLEPEAMDDYVPETNLTLWEEESDPDEDVQRASEDDWEEMEDPFAGEEVEREQAAGTGGYSVESGPAT